MLWLKAFHIIFVVTWFAGLLYLPRLLVYHAQASDAPSHERFVVMERRLLRLTEAGALLALGFGIATLLSVPAYIHLAWMHAKLGLVLLVVLYHGTCSRLVRQFRDGRNRRSVRWLKLFNEVPALLLAAIVILVVVKPF